MAIYTARREEMINVVRATLFYMNPDEPVPVHSLSALSSPYQVLLIYFAVLLFWYVFWVWLRDFIWIVDVIVTKNVFAEFLWCHEVGFYIIRTSFTSCLFIFSGSSLVIFQQRFSLTCFERRIRSLLSGPGGTIVTISTSMSQIHAFVCGHLAFQLGHQK